ncbi:MAG TPA: VWA domain-containing protein [Candidatus Acidoferrum sp.]|nr:VWA domain-containing protein [Candidatus Acidoferrum sp.]
MKAIHFRILLTLLACTLTLLLAEQRALAQAPAGQQPSSQPPVQPPPVTSQQEPQQGGVSISVEVPIVTLDVVATTQHGDLITGLKRDNFRIIEDGQPQTITNFGPTDAPLTIVMLMEFSSRGYYQWFAYQAKYWADAFFPNLQQKDWVALVTFDMRSRVEADFTQNKDEVRNALYHLYFPGFSESNVFDAILDTVDRLKDVKGKKSILVLATGIDTFSKHTLDQTIKQLRQSDVSIFAVGLDKPYTNFLDSHGAMGSHLNFLQGENQLRTFAQMTGGFAWFPQFDGEIPGIFHDVAAFLRNQYSISYSPTNRARDGKYRKLKVELVAPDGGLLTVLDQKGKKQKYVVYAREGYQAPAGN